MSHLEAYIYECIKPSCKAKYKTSQKYCRVCHSTVVLKDDNTKDDNEDISDKHDNE